jgi:glycosyltransferase involved in cell wall biosynthesis
MARSGFHVSVLALDPVGAGSPAGYLRPGKESDTWYGNPGQGRIREVLRPYRTIPLLERPNAGLWLRRMLSLAKQFIATHGTPDIIQAHSALWAGLAAARLKEGLGIPYVLTEHRGRFVSGNPHARAQIRPWHRPLLREAFEMAERVVTVSDALQDTIGTIAPACKPVMTTLYNMVDTAYFTPAAPSREPIPPGQACHFFSLAHLETHKGMDTLLEAMAMLCKGGADRVRLTIGGDGPERRRLQAMCARLQLDEKVRFTGHLTREQVRAHLREADAFVLASRFEAFGLVYAEAMSCGLPVIASRAGGAPGFVTRETGLICPPDRPGELAGAMKSLADQITGYRPDVIRKHAIRLFGQETIASRYAALYRNLVQKRINHA